MIEGKEGISRKNLIDFVFISILVVSILFIINPVIADTTFSLNITNQSGTGQVNFTFSLFSANNSTGSSLINAFMKEDIMYIFNFSFSHLSATKNLTGVNFTLPAGFLWAPSSNRTTNASSFTNFSFANTSGQYTLSWNNTNMTEFIINQSRTDPGQNNRTLFAFNITAPEPGLYNITIR
jgi:hypothetical protein